MDAALELPIQSPPASRPPTTLRPRQPPPHRSLSGKKPQSPRAPREVRFQKSPPILGRDGERAPGKGSKSKVMRLSPNAMHRSLLPATERKPQEKKKQDGRARAESDADRWDIAPDGGSAGREGRHFTVSNVGNNGRIYLRYDGLVLLCILPPCPDWRTG
jgi:hypothetical protein